MANVQHSSLTGAELHEPKGADSASSGEVYVSDGSGSGAWTALEDIDVPKDFAGTDGYIDLPGGLILQWGRVTSTSDGNQSFTFPKAFTTVCWTVSGAFEGSPQAVATPTLTTTSFTLDRNDSAGGTQYFRYIAIGY